MADTFNTANMGLVLPVVGLRADFSGSNDWNVAFQAVDAHDHSSGKGVSITPSGLNINSNLAFANNNATGVKGIVFNSNVAALTDNNSVYAVNGDLYFTNGSGSSVQITSGASINISSVNGITGLVSPASASYSAPYFSFKSAATTYAKMKQADLSLFQASAGIVNAVTLKSPNSLAASYNLVMPTVLPAGLRYLTLDSSGNMGTVTANAIAQAMNQVGADAIAVAMDSTGLNQIGNNMPTAGANSIGGFMTSTGANAVAASRTRAVTTNGTDPGIGGVSISASSGIYTITTITTDVPGLSCNLTTSGRPIMILLTAENNDTGNGSGVDVAVGVVVVLEIKTGPFDIFVTEIVAGTSSMTVPMSFSTILNPGSGGLRNFYVRATKFGSNTAFLRYGMLMVYEL